MTPDQEPRTGGSIFDRPESEITKEEWRAAAESWKRQHDEVFALGIRASVAGDKARDECSNLRRERDRLQRALNDEREAAALDVKAAHAEAESLIDPNDPQVIARAERAAAYCIGRNFPSDRTAWTILAALRNPS